jgi:hypothetical protein
MDSTREIDWAETIAYKMTTALRFSGIIDEDDYKLEQSARNELAAIVRRWCIPMERIQDWKTRAEAAERRVAELEAQLAAQEWRSGDEVPHEEGWYQTFNWGMYGHLYFSGGRWSKYPVPPKHWRKFTVTLTPIK